MITVKRYTINDTLLAEAGFGIRRTVFVEEQGVLPDEEFEGEEESMHFLLFSQDIPVATARWRSTSEGIKLERFAVLQKYRRKGFGNLLLLSILSELKSRPENIYLHVQESALVFYERNGFVRYGPPFYEYGIRHYAMKYAPQTIGSLTELIHKVYDFHESFGVGISAKPTVDLPEEEIVLRHRLMTEESEEYLAAALKGDMVEVADALGDQLYILLGTVLKHGLQEKMAGIFREIHNSNMSKLDAQGQPLRREDGKIIKSDRYFNPDLRQFLD